MTTLISNNAIADIIVTNDFLPLKALLKKADQDTLVIFDVDHVLIMPTDEYTLNRHPYRKELWKEIESRLSKEEMKNLYGITASKAKWRLIDQEIKNIFEDLKQRKIPTIALSSIYTGKFGSIEKLENWRINHLRELGFNFADLSPIKKDIFAYELEENDGVPMLKSGVALTAQIDKGKTLEYIFSHSNYYPKTIIFIDDQLNNIESLEKLSNKLKIKFHGIHYTAVSEMPVPVIDKEIEARRFQILEKELIWLSHEDLAQRETESSLNAMETKR